MAGLSARERTHLEGDQTERGKQQQERGFDVVHQGQRFIDPKSDSRNDSFGGTLRGLPEPQMALNHPDYNPQLTICRCLKEALDRDGLDQRKGREEKATKRWEEEEKAADENTQQNPLKGQQRRTRPQEEEARPEEERDHARGGRLPE